MMTTTQRIQFATTIKAPAALVWEVMFDAERFRRWAAAFAEGSYYEGSWDEGARIHFLVPSGDGMVSEIAERRPHEFLSIRHLGVVVGGVEDTESAAVRAWAPAYETYTFYAVPEGTRVVVHQDVTGDFEQLMLEAWPRALEALKGLCEAQEHAREASGGAKEG